jgi:transmembrane sensor
MQTTKQYYQNLLQRYLSDDLDEADTKELFDFIAGHPEQASEILRYNNSKAFEEKLNSENNIPKSISERMYERLLNEIRKPNIVKQVASNSQLQIRKVPFLRLHAWSAAAVVFLLFGSIIYFLFQPPRQLSRIATVQTVKKGVNDAMPGKDGAILTLSDGTQIVLDSLGNGIIAKQGKTAVMLKDGRLMYDQTDKRLRQIGDIAYNTMTTPKGRQYQLVLSDGTRIWLNAASSVKYPTVFTGTERQVEVTGEVYFEVAKNAKMPFKVNIGHSAEVEVLGTHFNINAYANEANIKTTLLEGSVKIKANNQIKMLEPGQQVQVNRTAGSMNLVRDVEVAKVVAWKNGAFSFSNADLPAVMRELERWYNVNVTYAGAVPTGRFSGEIGRGLALSEVLKLLTETRIRYRIEDGGNIIVLPDQ